MISLLSGRRCHKDALFHGGSAVDLHVRLFVRFLNVSPGGVMKMIIGLEDDWGIAGKEAQPCDMSTSNLIITFLVYCV